MIELRTASAALLRAPAPTAPSAPPPADQRLLQVRMSSRSPFFVTALSGTGYNLVILLVMKTAISLPDDTFKRVDHAAKRLGVSRSEFFTQAAERWLDALDDDGTTEAIDRAIAELGIDHAFTDAAAAGLAVADRT